MELARALLVPPLLKKWYSPIYISHGFRGIYGLDGNDPSFLSDTFWPMVFGQYGIIGFILTILLYMGIIKSCSRNLLERKYAMEIFLITMLSLALSYIRFCHINRCDWYVIYDASWKYG